MRFTVNVLVCGMAMYFADRLHLDAAMSVALGFSFGGLADGIIASLAAKLHIPK